MLSSVLIITGMHRSGTSLVAAFMQALGVDLGQNLLVGDSFNPPGYFEDVDFLKFQRSLLQACCHPSEPGWSDWGWTESEWLDRDQFTTYRASAQQLITTRSDRAEIWGWKDPRTSLLLDFWDQLIPQANYLLIYRFPWDVADSIKRSSGLGCFKALNALQIWQYYNSHLLKFYQTHRARCLLVNINSLLTSPDQFLNLLRSQLSWLSKLDLSPDILNHLYQPNLFTKLDLTAPLIQSFCQNYPTYFHTLEQLEQNADLPSRYNVLFE